MTRGGVGLLGFGEGVQGGEELGSFGVEDWCYSGDNRGFTSSLGDGIIGSDMVTFIGGALRGRQVDEVCSDYVECIDCNDSEGSVARQGHCFCHCNGDSKACEGPWADG